MKKHDWHPHRDSTLTFCFDCGIIYTKSNYEASCPPWVPTDEGDTNTKRVHEAGELKSLFRLITYHLSEASRILLRAGYPETANTLETDIDRLDNIIQKHEGLNKS